MVKQMPPVLIGFLVLLTLPALLAGLSIVLGLYLPYAVKLDLWTKPWVFAAWLVLFTFLVDVRRRKQTWLALPRAEILAMLALLVLSLGHRQFDVADTVLSDVQLSRALLAVGVGIAAYYAMAQYHARFAKPVYMAIVLGASGVLPALLVFVYIQAPADVPVSLFSWQLPGFGAVRLLGMALEVGIVVSLGLLLEAQGRKIRVWLWLSMIVLWAAVFWTGGRGAVLSIFGAAFVLTLARPALLKLIWSVLLASGAAGAALSLLLWVPEGLSFGLAGMFADSTRSGLDAISSGRIDRWSGAVSLIAERPWLGHGLGQLANLWPVFAEFDLKHPEGTPFPTYFQAYRTVHNMVLEILLAWGLLGGGLGLWLLLKGWVKSVIGVHNARSPLANAAFLGLNALLIHSLLAGVYAVPHGLFFMALFFGICLAPNPAQNENTTR